MSNRSYNFTSAKPATGTFGSSKEIRDEFTSLQAGFATIEGEIDALDAAKADIAGETYTGTHDFTGATVQVATPTIAAHSANKDYVDTEIGSLNTAKADITGETYSGTHDFTGAVIEVAAPTSAQEATTKTYVDYLVTSTAFSSILPLQAGNAGKYVSTDGTNATWKHLFVPPAMALGVL